MTARLTIDQILAAARARLERLEPRAVRQAQGEGAVLVDIRPAAQRVAGGQIPGALVVERNVLEWRFDPASDARLPIAERYDLPVIVYCEEGYTSSLAAAALQDLGLYRATDLVGGICAWRAAGLPVEPAGQMTAASKDRDLIGRSRTARSVPARRSRAGGPAAPGATTPPAR